MVQPSLSGAPKWVYKTGPRLLGALGAVLLFLFAVQLLGAATEAAAGPLERIVRQYVLGDGSALGLSWLSTYALTNGSVVAALSVSLFSAGILDPSQLFLMVAGSRLGGAGIVVLIGALDYVQKRRYSLGEATQLGLLTFLVTLSVFVPGTLLGRWLVPVVEPLAWDGSLQLAQVRALSVLRPLTGQFVEWVGTTISLLVAVSLLFLSLTLFDRVLSRVDTNWLRTRFFDRFSNRWLGFVLGVLVTGTTTSVAFSLGVVVPLYNRGYVKRQEIVPYILGANLGTFFDTIVVAVLLDSPTGLLVVLTLVGVGTLWTVGLLIVYDPFSTVLGRAHDRLVGDPRYFVGFLALLIVCPLALIVLPV